MAMWTERAKAKERERERETEREREERRRGGEEERWSQLELEEGMEEREEGCGFSIIQSDNMPLSRNGETLPDSLELGRLVGKRIMRDDGICHHLRCPGKIVFDRAMRRGACHVPRAGHRGSLAEMIFAICASVVKASQPICQKSEVETADGGGAFVP